MSAINDGGPAFPVPVDMDRDGVPYEGTGVPGMSLRDYFAAKAMAIVAASPDMPSVGTTGFGPCCYALADDMLATRETQP